MLQRRLDAEGHHPCCGDAGEGGGSVRAPAGLRPPLLAQRRASLWIEAQLLLEQDRSIAGSCVAAASSAPVGFRLDQLATSTSILDGSILAWQLAVTSRILALQNFL